MAFALVTHYNLAHWLGYGHSISLIRMFVVILTERYFGSTNGGPFWLYACPSLENSLEVNLISFRNVMSLLKFQQVLGGSYHNTTLSDVIHKWISIYSVCVTEPLWLPWSQMPGAGHESGLREDTRTPCPSWYLLSVFH